MEVPFDRLLNWVYMELTANMEEKDRNRFDSDINMPLPGQTAVDDGVWSDDEMGRSFMALSSELKGA